MTFDELRKADVSRCRQVWPKELDWTPEEWLASVLGELGEVAHALKDAHQFCEKGKRDASDRSLSVRAKNEVANEIADTVLYLDLLAHRCGIDLGAAVAHKFNTTSRKVGSDILLPEVA